MVLKRFYHEKLAQASYLVGSPEAGEALIIDPNRDLEQYVEAAAEEGMRITTVAETHIHADYLSGARELAVVTGAQLYLSDEGDKDWKYGYASETGAKLTKGGDSFRIGPVRIDVIKTSGHTPEHISFLITDEANSKEPLGIFSGDFIFVGDVGRPDLLETAAGVQGTMETGARQLFQSLKSISGLAEHVLVWPGHGAGSACGKALGALPVSSMGYERITNWALGAQSEDSFVREVLSGQPEPPAYFAQMKRLNKEGPPLLSGFRVPPRRLDGRILPKYIAAGIVVIDVREPEAYMAKHIKGTLHIPQYKNFITWAGSLVPYDTDLLLIAPEESRAAEAAKDLAMIGLDRVVGWYGEDVFAEFEGPEGEMEPMDQIPASWLLGSLDEFVVVDVRSKSEWDAGHVPGAIHMPLPSLAKRAQELPRDRKLILHCEGGVRSTIAVSFLYSIGFRDVVNVVDGYRAYEKAKREEALPR